MRISKTFRYDGVWRLALIAVLTSSILAASAPCAWMIAASSPHNCCKKSVSLVSDQERCPEQTITSCCAARPQTIVATSSVAWGVGWSVAPAPVVGDRPVERAVSLIETDPVPLSYLQHSVLRI